MTDRDPGACGPDSGASEADLRPSDADPRSTGAPAGESLALPVADRAVVDCYDRVAGVYDRLVAPVEFPDKRRAIDLLDPAAGERVLEVGCGPGRALVELAGAVGPDGRVVGVDAAPAMLDRAARRVRRARLADRAALLRGDARRLPVADGSVDAVFAADVLELLPRAGIDAALAAVRRVLAPGGRCVVVATDRAGREGAAFVRAYERAFRAVPGLARVGCRPVDAGRRLRRAGFRVEATRTARRAGVWPSRTLLARPE